MTKTFPRHTLQGQVSLSGPGLHSGLSTSIRIEPSSNGIMLITSAGAIPAHVSQVTDTSRCTQVGEVSTVEHLLSALAGLGVTDCDVIVEGTELPAADGCSATYVHAILEVGLAPAGHLEIDGPFDRVFHVDGETRIAIGTGDGHWGCVFELEGYFIQRSEFEWRGSAAEYAAEIAPARTVVLEEELDAVKKLGLGKGLDDDSCLGIGFKSYLNPARFPDEPVRHKMLDLIGDLALAGVPAGVLNVSATRSGHRANIAAAAKLAERIEIRRYQ